MLMTLSSPRMISMSLTRALVVPRRSLAVGMAGEYGRAPPKGHGSDRGGHQAPVAEVVNVAGPRGRADSLPHVDERPEVPGGAREVRRDRGEQRVVDVELGRDVRLVDLDAKLLEGVRGHGDPGVHAGSADRVVDHDCVPVRVDRLVVAEVEAVSGDAGQR